MNAKTEQDELLAADLAVRDRLRSDIGEALIMNGPVSDWPQRDLDNTTDAIDALIDALITSRDGRLHARLSSPVETGVAGDGVANEAKFHAVNLEQCSLFVDSPPLARSMTDAAVFLRALSAPPARSEAMEAGELAELLEDTGCRDREDLADMARCGMSLLDEIASIARCQGQFRDWGWLDDPAEIVTALFNALQDVTAERDEALRASKYWKRKFVCSFPDCACVSNESCLNTGSPKAAASSPSPALPEREGK